MDRITLVIIGCISLCLRNDIIGFDFVVLSRVYDDTGVPERPSSGSIINGPFLEGCRWNDDTELLDESRPKELYTPMPCIWLKPEAHRVSPLGPPPFFPTIDASVKQAYACPLYKTLGRAGTLSTSGHSTNHVMEIELPSDKPQSHWIKRSVALFCSLRD